MSEPRTSVIRFVPPRGGPVAGLGCAMVLLVLLASTPIAAPAATGKPIEHVRGAVEQVIAVLRTPQLSRDARWRRISAVVREHFDFDAMSRRVLGSEWRRATPQARQRFARYFSQYLEVTLRTQIENYDGHRVEYVAETVRGGRATVETVVVSDKVRTPVTYKLRQATDAGQTPAWLGYDVVIEGISLVANYRNTFAAIAKSEGLDGLIEDVRRRVERHRLRHPSRAGS